MKPSSSIRQAAWLVVGFAALGTVCLAATDWEGTPQQAFLEGPIVARYQCTTCHTVTDDGGTVGPILNRVGARRTEEWLRRWLADPQKVKPNTKMPRFDFTPEEFDLVVSSLAGMTTPVNADRILAGGGTPAGKGEELFRAHDCLACHRVGNQGRFVGPDLTWLGLRKTRRWERTWLADPPAFKPDTFMPDFELSEGEIEALTAYLEDLKGQANEEAQSWEFMVNMFLNNKAPRRGEYVFKRFACWSCHGEEGKGGIRNPNAAPDELMPPLTRASLSFSLDDLRERLSKRQPVEALDSARPAPPFSCPDYGQVISGDEYEELHAYLQSRAPKKSKWKVR